MKLQTSKKNYIYIYYKQAIASQHEAMEGSTSLMAQAHQFVRIGRVWQSYSNFAHNCMSLTNQKKETTWTSSRT